MKKNDYNESELKQLAPTLFSIEKKGVFSVPKDYFDSLPEEIMASISSSPLLQESTEVNPFEVPENYFEKLSLNIINRIEAEQRKRFSLAGLLAQVIRPKYSLSLIAACVAAILCVRYFEKPVTLNIYGAASGKAIISDSDLLSDVDESTLVNAISEENDIALKTKTTTTDKNVEDYIIDNNIDITDIAKEL